MIVYDERMKAPRHAKIFPIIYICLCFFIIMTPVFAQGPAQGPTMTGEFTDDELNAFHSQGYLLRTHLPHEAYNRLILGKISPLHVGFGEEVHFEAHNDLHGRFSVFVQQRDTFRSIDGQRLLDVSCCLDLYKEHITQQKNDFSDGFKKTFTLPKLDKTVDGTFNDVMNIYVFPDY